LFKGIIPTRPTKEIPRTPIAGVATCADSTFDHQRNPNLTVDFSRERVVSTSTPYHAATSLTNRDSPPNPDATFVVYHVPKIGKSTATEDEVFDEDKGSDSASHKKANIQIKKATPFETFVKDSEEVREDKEKKTGDSWNLEMESDTNEEELHVEPEIVKPIKKLTGNRQKDNQKAADELKEKSEKPPVEVKENNEADSAVPKSKKTRGPKKAKALVEEEFEKVEHEAGPPPEIKEKRGRGRKPKAIDKEPNSEMAATAEPTPQSADQIPTEEIAQPTTKSSAAVLPSAQPDSPDEPKIKKTKGRAKKEKICEAIENKEAEIVEESNNDLAKEVRDEITESETSPTYDSKISKKRGGKAKEETSEEVPVAAALIGKSTDLPLASTSTEETTDFLMDPSTGATNSVINREAPVIEKKETKKRGRKPKDPVAEDLLVENKADHMNIEVKEDEVLPETGSIPRNNEPKKRGRKPKEQGVEVPAIVEEEIDHINDQDASTEQKAHSPVVEVKKRGRKPKEQTAVTESENVETIAAADMATTEAALVQEDESKEVRKRGRKAEDSGSRIQNPGE